MNLLGNKIIDFTAAAWRGSRLLLGSRTRMVLRGLKLAHPIAEEPSHGSLPDADTLRARLEPRGRRLPADIPVALTALAQCDALLGADA